MKTKGFILPSALILLPSFLPVATTDTIDICHMNDVNLML